MAEFQDKWKTLVPGKYTKIEITPDRGQKGHEKKFFLDPEVEIEMHIVIDNSGYQLGNMGDVAMLQVAVARFQKMWPDASIHVITRRPDRLKVFCPNAVPLSVGDSKNWFRHRCFMGRIRKMLPQTVSEELDRIEFSAKHQHPELFWSMLNLKNKVPGIAVPARVKIFRDVVTSSDIVVATGGGYITDAFKRHAMELLATLDIAIQLGKRTAMFGQGLGPIQDPDLYRMCCKVLPKVDFIFLRESKSGIPLLRAMNVAGEKVMVTGDDAISVVLENLEDNLGSGIGINVRAAYYSDVDLNALNFLKKVLAEAGTKVNGDLIPVPISFHDFDSDIKSLKILLGGDNKEIKRLHEINTPQKVVKQISRCKIVLTGSYHGAVFALSQGIPVIALAQSEYYVHKFKGVADQFGTGCEVANLEECKDSEIISNLIKKQWELSEKFRPQLLASAKKQLAASNKAYNMVNNLFK